MRRLVLILSALHLLLLADSRSGRAEEFKIAGLQSNGTLTFSGAQSPGVCTVETAQTALGPWAPLQNFFTTNSTGAFQLLLANQQSFVRLATVDLPPTATGFSNLCSSYGRLETIAGTGQRSADGVNGWQPQFEGGPATDAELSRPHFAMADDAGNIYVADKDGQAIRKITPAGTLVTVAGTNVAGDDGDGPGPATQMRLSSPNGLWVRGDGTVYILDLDNGKVRRLDPQGMLTTLFTVDKGIDTGRGLWVKDDESLVYFASGTALRKWTPSGGVKTVANTFLELGNLLLDPAGNLVVTDRGANRVYRVSKSGTKTPIAGSGNPTGGGDGALALETGLAGVRGVWFLPTGGYLLATHEGSQIWYVDTAAIIHLFVDGAPGAHAGDGEYFRTPGYKLSEIRAVTMDRLGRILVTENDGGFIRSIDFLRMTP